MHHNGHISGCVISAIWSGGTDKCQTHLEPPLPAARHGVCITGARLAIGVSQRQAELLRQVPDTMHSQSATALTQARVLTYAEVKPSPKEWCGNAHAHELRDGVPADLILVQGPRGSDDGLLRRGVRLCDRLLRRSGVRLAYHLLTGCAPTGSFELHIVAGQSSYSM